MEAVNVSGLKNNPSEALRLARRDVVVVMNRDQPDAWMVVWSRPGCWAPPACGQRWPRPCSGMVISR